MSDSGVCNLQRNVHTPTVNFSEMKQENIFNGRNNPQT